MVPRIAITVVCIGLLLCCALGFNVEPDPLISECLSVKSNKNFDESQITHHWRATHYSSPAYFFFGNESQCITADIQSVDKGISVTFEMQINGSQTNSSDIQTRTQTPGLYNVDSTDPTGTAVYVHHLGHLLIYGCFHYEDQYEDFSLILTKGTDPNDDVLQFFKKHVNDKREINEEYFYKFPDSDCS